MRMLKVPSAVEPARPRRAPALLVLALLALPIMAGCSQQSPAPSGPSTASDPVVARVNGFDIRESHLSIAEDELLAANADLQQMPPEVRRQQLLNYTIQIMILAQAGEAKKLQDSDDFKRRLAFQRAKILMALALQAHGREAASEEALRKIYDEKVRPMGATEEVRARHILFLANPKDEKSLAEAEAKARAALERIKAGEDFAAVAKELTEDPSGKENGGDLGYFTKAKMVPEFANVAFQMYPGQVSNPVRTQFGWHIIKLEDRRNTPVPEFEKVREQIEMVVARHAQEEYFRQLIAKAKIERLDKSGAPIPPAAPPKAPPPGGDMPQMAPSEQKPAPPDPTKK
jgi:peptidyl-prolyl cis-trans isomerase C